MTASAGRWQRFTDGGWHRQALTCRGCQATTHDPTAFGWSGLRDISGHLIARCRKCAPVTVGKSADATFGPQQRGATRGQAVRARQVREAREAAEP